MCFRWEPTWQHLICVEPLTTFFKKGWNLDSFQGLHSLFSTCLWALDSSTQNSLLVTQVHGCVHTTFKVQPCRGACLLKLVKIVGLPFLMSQIRDKNRGTYCGRLLASQQGAELNLNEQAAWLFQHRAQHRLICLALSLLQSFCFRFPG